jgi:hypothetical protein
MIPTPTDALSTTAAEVDKTTERPRVVLSESAREIVQRVGFGRFGAPLMRQQ